MLEKQQLENKLAHSAVK